MKILVISYFDDNFGDMLIRICFSSLLKTVLKNLGISEADYEIVPMPLKQVDEELVRSSNLICFAGGGLFGLSYLDFFQYLNQITDIAEEQDIPVIFSSTGVNNMDANAENEQHLYAALRKKCIKAISVRENIDLFRKYCDDADIPICQVCDPAVWTKYVYAHELPPAEAHRRPVVGVNVVRGGLFKSNDYSWTLSTEVAYLEELWKLLEAAGLDYRFYTNGSLVDNNTMHFFSQEKGVPTEKLIVNHSTRDLVRSISSFDAVIAIRMHSSIVSYSLGVPSVNLIWNDKVPLFYRYIGYPERAIPLDAWQGAEMLPTIQNLLEQKDYAADRTYAMSVYQYLYDTIGRFVDTSAAAAPYDFDAVAADLAARGVPIEDELTDLHWKLVGAERKHLKLFRLSRENTATIKEQSKELKKREQEIAALRKQLAQTQSQLKDANARLQRIDALLPMKVYKKLKKTIQD